MQKLPRSVQDIADVIGRERALFLIGMLPRCFMQDSRNPDGKGRGSERVFLYAPKTLKPDHHLVAILGWHDAAKLTAEFGGELVNLPTLRELVYRPFRDEQICHLASIGMQPADLAAWFGLSEKRVRQVMAAGGIVPEIPQEGCRTAANDNARKSYRAA